MDRPVEITRSYAECKFCNDIADMCNEIPDCTHCENRKGTWIDTITSLHRMRLHRQTRKSKLTKCIYNAMIEKY